MMKKQIILISVVNHHPLTWEHDKAFLEKLRDAVRMAIREKTVTLDKEHQS